MTPGALGVALLAAALMAACASPLAMGGFSDREARVVAAPVSAVDACTVRTGLLVVEIAHVVVNEYPHHGHASTHAQQPLLVRSIFAEGQPEQEGDIQAWVSPLHYQSGQGVDSFAALRVVERPLRAMTGKHIVLRLAENDRTGPDAGWNNVAQVAGGAAGAGAAVGIPVLPSALLQEGVHLLAKTDRDDLIMLWAVDAASLTAPLAGGGERTAGQATELAASWPPAKPTPSCTLSAPAPAAAPPARALRFLLETPRRVPGSTTPAAIAEILVYREPERGCP